MSISTGAAHHGAAPRPQMLSEAGDEAASFTLYKDHFDPAVIARFTIDGEPTSKARARFARSGAGVRTYTPEKTYRSEQAVAWAFRQAARGHRLDPDISYGVFVLFFCGTRQRRDVDNMLKLVLDGLNKIAWPDDAQVVEISGRKSFCLREDARTEVVIYQVGHVDRPTGACEHCGGKFEFYESQAKRRFCSQACHLGWRRTQRQRTCEHCGTEFDSGASNANAKYCGMACVSAARRTTVTCDECKQEFTKQRCHVRKNNYCSVECNATAARARRKSAAKGECESCGGPVSKKTYRQCSACRAAALGLPRSVEAASDE